MNVIKQRTKSDRCPGTSPTQYFHRNAIPPLVLIAVAMMLSSCDLLGSDEETSLRAGRVLVANGGNFSDQNGSITSFDPLSGVVEQSPVMSGFLQSIVEREGVLYALLNTFSIGRIDMLDSESLALTAQINNVPAPRSMVFLSDTAYVTNFVFGSNGHVSVIPSGSGSVERSIEVGVNPEGLIRSGATLYVANSGALGSGNTISVIDTRTNEVETRTVPCDGPHDLFGGNGSDVIVACTGKTVYNEDFSEVVEQSNGSVLFYDASLQMMKGKIDLNVQLGSTNGTILGTYVDSTGELYLVDGATNTIFRIDTGLRTIDRTVQLDFSADVTGISGIAYDELEKRLYVGRFPKSSAGPFPDFTASGTVEIYDRSFDVTDSFLAGISISQILLLKDE